MAKNVFKLSTMVGENFEIYFSQMAKNAFKLPIFWHTHNISLQLCITDH